MSSRSVVRVAILVAIALPSAGCGDEGARVRREIEEALAAIRTYSHSQKDRFEERFDSSLDRLEIEIDRLEAKAAAGTADARRRLEPRIAELEREAADVRDRMRAAIQAGVDSWNSQRDESCRRLEALEEEVERCRREHGLGG